MVRIATALALLLAAPAGAADCRLALLLGLDISSSVDDREDALQRGGLARALTSDRVEAAFFATGAPVALAAFEWSGRYNQEVLLDWTLITTPKDLQRAAESIGTSRRSYDEFPTAFGEALIFAQDMIARGPDCWRRTIDMAGDGVNNEGPSPQTVYEDNAAYHEITVNGLVVVNAADFQTPHRLTQFYAEEVLHGDGSFMVETNGFADYERAMRIKLERELDVAIIGRADPDAGDPRG